MMFGEKLGDRNNDHQDSVDIQNEETERLDGITQDRAQAVELLDDGRIKFPYSYGGKACEIFFTNKDSLVYADVYSNGKILEKAKLMPTESLDKFGTEIGAILDRYIGIPRASVPDKAEEAYEFLGFGLEEKRELEKLEEEARKMEFQRLLNSEDYSWDENDKSLSFNYSTGSFWSNVSRDYYLKLHKVGDEWHFSMTRTQNFFFPSKTFVKDKVFTATELKEFPEYIEKVMPQEYGIKNKKTLSNMKNKARNAVRLVEHYTK